MTSITAERLTPTGRTPRKTSAALGIDDGGGDGWVYIHLGMETVRVERHRFDRFLAQALPPPAGGPEGLAQLQDAAARLVRTGLPERHGEGLPNTAAAARVLIAETWRQSRIAAGVCPECGSHQVEHERGLLFCAACGHTAQEAPDDRT